MSARVVEVEDLTKAYRQFGIRRKVSLALENVSLEIQQGEILAILGLNGAGKSTLIKILLGLIRPTSGRARLFGSEVDHGAWRNRVGYLPELFRAPLDQSGLSVLRFLGSMSGLTGNRLKERVAECLEIVDLSGAASQKTKTYSKGMMVRLGIAQAILPEPELLFFDEPTEGLDPVGKVMIRKLLVGMAGKGTTIVLNSHLLSEVEYVANRVAILHKGKLMRVGTLEELVPRETRFIVEFPTPVALPFPWNQSATDDARGCEVQSTQKLHELLEYLKSNGVEPSTIRPFQATLEQTFLKYIGDK